jgi:hypothetical protein
MESTRKTGNPYFKRLTQAAHGLGVAGTVLLGTDTTAGLETYAKAFGGVTATQAQREGAGIAILRVVDANTLDRWLPGGATPVPVTLVEINANLQAGEAALLDGESCFLGGGAAGQEGKFRTLRSTTTGEADLTIGRFDGGLVFLREVGSLVP